MAQVVLVNPIPKVPVTVPGFGMAALMKHIHITVKSNSVLFSDTTAGNLLELLGNEVIVHAQVDVTAAFDASGTSAAATATLTVPGATGAVTIWDAANLKLQTLTSDVLSPSTNAGFIKVPASGGFLAFTFAPGTTTVGAFEVYLTYLPDATKL